MTGQLVLITGATGFVGFRTLLKLLDSGYRARVVVRRESSIKEIRENALVAPFAAKDLVEFVIVPDITADGAFDAVLKDVVYIEHIASPMPAVTTTDLENNMIIPAVKGTTSILESALKEQSIRRVVITSSVAAIVPAAALMNGDSEGSYNAYSRISPLPTGPWDHPGIAYFNAKSLALDATDRFLEEKKPHFSIVNLIPGFIFGRNELATTTDDLQRSTNSVILDVVLGKKTDATPCAFVDVRDVARIHVESLDESKVSGNKSFCLFSPRKAFEDANEIAAREFPEAVKQGLLPLGGVKPSLYSSVDSSETVKTFGPMYTYDDAVKVVVSQYLELKGTA